MIREAKKDKCNLLEKERLVSLQIDTQASSTDRTALKDKSIIYRAVEKRLLITPPAAQRSRVKTCWQGKLQLKGNHLGASKGNRKIEPEVNARPIDDAAGKRQLAGKSQKGVSSLPEDENSCPTLLGPK